MNGIKRELFPILNDKRYFNTCSVGALGEPVKEAASKFMEQWDTLAGLSWGLEDGWVAAVEEARMNFARLINARSENIAYSFGNSVALSSVTSCFIFDKKNEVIFNELDFPATATHLMGKAINGAKYQVVKSADGRTVSTDDYRTIVNEKTSLITACHVVSNTGFKVNEQELVELASEKDIPVFLDVYQSLGVLPVDVKKLDVDFLASGCLKWLLGGFGLSFLYVRDDWLEKGNPGSIGWMGVDDPFADLYDKLRSTLHRPVDARKYQYGTPYPSGAVTASAGMKIIDEITIPRIYQHNGRLTQRLIDGASDLGLTTSTPENAKDRGSIVNIQVDEAEKVVEKLQGMDFVLDMRASGVRVSPHFYNSFDDIDSLLEELATIIRM